MKLRFRGQFGFLMGLASGFFALGLVWGSNAPLQTPSPVAQRYLASEAPWSEPVAQDDGLTPEFCQTWNPEFKHQGFLCCADPKKMRARNRRGRSARLCDPRRNRQSYCSEMTPEQRRVVDGGPSMVEELLTRLERRLSGVDEQAQCGPNTGFLAFGKPLLGTEENRVQIRSPERCTNFGTDSMVNLLDWLGKKVAVEYSEPEFSKVRLVVGDMAAPRGGCLAGAGGRRGHFSHTNGLDVDLTFLVAHKNRPSPVQFHQQFDAKVNWWLVKNLLENPFACVNRVFLDRRLIAKLDRVAQNDPLWKESRKVFQHQRNHRNHFHIRLGLRPGAPGCQDPNLDEPEEELEQDLDSGLELPEVPRALASEEAPPAAS